MVVCEILFHGDCLPVPRGVDVDINMHARSARLCASVPLSVAVRGWTSKAAGANCRARDCQLAPRSDLRVWRVLLARR